RQLPGRIRNRRGSTRPAVNRDGRHDNGVKLHGRRLVYQARDIPTAVRDARDRHGVELSAISIWILDRGKPAVVAGNAEDTAEGRCAAHRVRDGPQYPSVVGA